MTAGVILDIDGTLVDTNYQHAIAWYLAFRQSDLTIPVRTLHHHVGMGGDQFVAAVAGAEAERDVGDDVRTAHDTLYMATIETVSVFDGAPEFVRALKAAGHEVVLSSSAKDPEVEHYLDLLEAREVVDGWTTSVDVEQTKPEPDLVRAALQKLDVDDDDAVLIGDTPWDVEAAGRAGLRSFAVTTGGFSPTELREAGAEAVFASLAELGDQLASLLQAPADQASGSAGG